MQKLGKIAIVCLVLGAFVLNGVGLFPFAAPVSANPLAWSAVNIPSTGGNVLVGANIEITAVAISPNFAVDNTVFAGVQDTVTPVRPQVYRSTDGGYNWTPSLSTLGAAVGDVIVGLVVSPFYATDRTIVVATQTPAGGAGTGIVYRSADGGATFAQLGIVTLAAGEVITSVDISHNYDGVGAIAVSIANVFVDTYATASKGIMVWGLGGILNWSQIGPLSAVTGVDVLSVKFSPAYAVDATILCITADAGTGAGGDMATTQPYLRARVIVWDTPIAPTLVGAAGVTDLGATGSAVTKLAMAIPFDYNASVASTRHVFVTVVAVADIAGGIPTATRSGVYRIIGSGALSTGEAITPVYVELMGSIAFSGTYAAGMLITGRFQSANDYAFISHNSNYADDAESASLLWRGARNAPTGRATLTGQTVAVALDPTNFTTSGLAVAGTSGSDSAFSICTDGAADYWNWNETGLIDNAGAELLVIGDVALSAEFATDNTMFMVTDDSSGGAFNTSVWRTTNGGTSWLRLMVGAFTGPGTGTIAVSPAFETDSSLYVGDIGAKQVFYSANSGIFWSQRPIPDGAGYGTITALAATDANTLYVGDPSGRVAKTNNAGWVWSLANVKATGASTIVSIVAAGSTIVVGDNDGGAFISIDTNATWTRIGTGAAGAGASYVDFDGDYVYLAAAGGGAYRFQVGVDTDWATLTPGSPPETAGRGIAIADDDTLYILDAAAVANQQVYRTLTPNITPVPAANFEWMTGLTAVAANDINVVSGASNIIVTVQGTLVRILTDTLTAGSPGPTLLGPANGFVLSQDNTVTLSVDNSSNNQVTSWDILLSTDPTFTSNVGIWTQVPPATQITINLATMLPAPAAGSLTLTTNQTVYWKARASSGLPVRGPDSEVRTFSPSAIPEFPTVIAGIVVAGACFSIYWAMRKRTKIRMQGAG